MSKKMVEELLIAGGGEVKIRLKYDALKTKEEFIQQARIDGYEFSIEELNAVLRESGDSFDLVGNPTKRMIWWS
jgi:hypothetical protein